MSEKTVVFDKSSLFFFLSSKENFYDLFVLNFVSYKCGSLKIPPPSRLFVYSQKNHLSYLTNFDLTLDLGIILKGVMCLECREKLLLRNIKCCTHLNVIRRKQVLAKLHEKSFSIFFSQTSHYLKKPVFMSFVFLKTLNKCIQIIFLFMQISYPFHIVYKCLSYNTFQLN